MAPKSSPHIRRVTAAPVTNAAAIGMMRDALAELRAMTAKSQRLIASSRGALASANDLLARRISRAPR